MTDTELAPDRSPVAFYRRLPAKGEPELIHGLIRPGGTILARPHRAADG